MRELADLNAAGRPSSIKKKEGTSDLHRTMKRGEGLSGENSRLFIGRNRRDHPSTKWNLVEMGDNIRNKAQPPFYRTNDSGFKAKVFELEPRKAWLIEGIHFTPGKGGPAGTSKEARKA